MKKNVSSQSGFTLVEILIAAGLLGLLSLGLMKISTQQVKTQKTAETSFEIRSLASEISQILLSAEGCKNTFDDVGSIQNPISISEIKNRSDDTKFSTGDTFNGNVQIQDMQLRDLNFGAPTPPTNNRFGEGILAITFQKLSNMAQGGKTIVEEFPLKFGVDNNYNVLNCYGATENAVDTAKKEACENIGGTYNSSTDMCDLSDYPTPLAEDISVSNQYLEDYIDDYKSNTLDDIYVNSDGDTMTGDLTAPNLRSQDSVCIDSNCRQDFSTQSCPDGEMMKGINSDGSLQCEPLNFNIYVKSQSGGNGTSVYCNDDDTRTGCSTHDPSSTGENNEADAIPLSPNGCRLGEEGGTIYAYCVESSP